MPARTKKNVSSEPEKPVEGEKKPEGQVCPNCKTVNPTTNLFCQSCGTRLKAEVPMPNMPQAYGQPVYPAAVPPAYQGQPQYGTPPQGYAPQSYPPYRQAYYGAPSLNKLGIRREDYADVMRGAGDKAAEVNSGFMEALQAKGLPMTTITSSEFGAGSGPSARRRAYTLATNYSGASVATYIAPLGKDLAVSWELYMRRTFRWIPIGIMAAIAIVLPLFTSFINIPLGNLFGGSSVGTFVFPLYIVQVIGLALLVPVVAMFLGKLLRNSWWHFLVEEADPIASGDAAFLAAAVHDALMHSLEKAGVDDSTCSCCDK